MAQQQPLSDRDLLGIWRDERTTDADLALLTAEEQTRLATLVESQEQGPSGLERALGALPAVGGVVGGLAGGASGALPSLGLGALPGAMGGAALGGATGASLEQLLRGLTGLPVPETAGEAVGGVASEAALQGGLEGAGGLMGRGLMAGARGLMRRAVRPSERLQRGFGDITDTLLTERLGVGKAAKATTRREGSAATTRQALGEAGQAGIRFAPQDLLGDVSKIGERFLRQGLEPDAPQFRELISDVTSFVDTHAESLTPDMVKEIKTAAQEAAKALFATEKETGRVIASPLAKQFQQALARGARQALEQMPEFGPRVAASERRTQRLIGAERALRSAELRNPPALAQSTVAAVLYSFGVRPRTLSRLGLSLSHPATQAIVRQLPRVGAEGVRQTVRSPMQRFVP